MTRKQRTILIMSILASFVAFLDSSVVNVALPAIQRELGGGLVLQQWVSDAYLITLGALILAAGSLSDLFGRKKILSIGLYGFLVASLFCALAPSSEILIFARALQGVAGALLVPSSLAFIIATFSGSTQSKAIGTWTAWTGMAFIAGPLVGGALVDITSWRLVFAINVIPILVSLMLLRKVEEERVREKKRVDSIGILLCAFSLAAVVFGLIEQPHQGWNVEVSGSIIIGLTAFIGFLLYEKHHPQPMLPLDLFRVRNFSAGNVATFFIYAALSLQGFLLIIFLQEVAGYKATSAGLAFVPVTIIMFLLSSRFGALAGKYGPRLFMTIGPFISASGMFLLLQMNAHADYLTQLLPGIVLFGVGLSITVAPLTSVILGSIHTTQSGIGSAINNAVARIAGLLAIALIGIFTGSSITLQSFRTGIIVCITLLILGGFISLLGIRNKVHNPVIEQNIT